MEILVGGILRLTMMEWAEKYYLPYIQTTEKYVSGKYVVIGLKNGSGFTNYGQHYFFCVKFKDCKDVLEISNPRDRFIFAFQVERNLSRNAESTTFRPYTWNWDGTRENLIDGVTHKCKRNGGYGHCAKLIEFDGWKISDDYPW